MSSCWRWKYSRRFSIPPLGRNARPERAEDGRICGSGARATALTASSAARAGLPSQFQGRRQTLRLFVDGHRVRVWP